MSKSILLNLLLATSIAATLSACVKESNSEPSASAVQSGGMSVEQRPIDWDAASKDSSQPNKALQTRLGGAAVAVPMLMPPSEINISNATKPLTFAAPKSLIDEKGYSAVIAGDKFDMLIDATNQMMRTDDAASEEYPMNFDGDYQTIEGGAQLTIGRYGALYSIQFICSDAATDSCIDEKTAREIVDALKILRP